MSPRARKEIVRPRRQSGAACGPSTSPLEVTSGEFSAAKSWGGRFGWLCGVRMVTDSVVLQASSFGATDVRVRLGPHAHSCTR